MDAGRLREAVDIWRRKMVRSARGAPVATFNLFEADVPAAVKPLTGKSLEVARATATLATHEVRMRAVGMEDLGERDRFLWRHGGRDRILEIESIVNIGARDRELVVIAQELVGQTDVTAA